MTTKKQNAKSMKVVAKNHEMIVATKQENSTYQDEKLILAMIANYATKWVDLSGLNEEDRKKAEYELEQAAKSLTNSLGADGLLQNMLAVQILGVHELQQKLLTYANRSMHYPEHGQYYMNAITKLSNVFIQQVNALQKLQGNCQQKVIVKHLHINEGGQAIVGQVNAHKEGGYMNEK